jgi:hypothetical protein
MKLRYSVQQILFYKWGTAAVERLKAYQCLGEMYTQDERFTLVDGKPNPAFAQFLCKAIAHFVQTVARSQSAHL